MAKMKASEIIVTNIKNRELLYINLSNYDGKKGYFTFLNDISNFNFSRGDLIQYFVDCTNKFILDSHDELRLVSLKEIYELIFQSTYWGAKAHEQEKMEIVNIIKEAKDIINNQVKKSKIESKSLIKNLLKNDIEFKKNKLKKLMLVYIENQENIRDLIEEYALNIDRNRIEFVEKDVFQELNDDKIVDYFIAVLEKAIDRGDIKSDDLSYSVVYSFFFGSKGYSYAERNFKSDKPIIYRTFRKATEILIDKYKKLNIEKNLELNIYVRPDLNERLRRKEILNKLTPVIIEKVNKGEIFKADLETYKNEINRYYMSYLENDILSRFNDDELINYFEKLFIKIFKDNLKEINYINAYMFLFDTMPNPGRIKSSYPILYRTYRKAVDNIRVKIDELVNVELLNEEEGNISCEKEKFYKKKMEINEKEARRREAKSNDRALKQVEKRKIKLEETLKNKWSNNKSGKVYQDSKKTFIDNYYQVLDIITNFSEKDLREYLNNIVKNDFNRNRVRVSVNTLVEFIFNIYGETKVLNKIVDDLRARKLTTIFGNVVLEQAESQKQILINSNINEINSNKDVWELFYIEGISLYSQKVDFTDIKSETLKFELKMFLRYLYARKEVTFLYKRYMNIKRVLNVVYDEFGILYLKDLNQSHGVYILNYLKNVKGYAPSSIKGTKASFCDIIEFLMEHKTYKNKPMFNIFREINLSNSTGVKDKTDYIPDEVMEQIDAHIDELSEKFRLMYKLFSYTGARAKEVVNLEVGCSQKIKTDDKYCQISYIPHKVVNARLEKGLSEYHTVYIPEWLHDEINNYIDTHIDNECIYKSKYIFADISNYKNTLPRCASFCRAVNKIIKKYNITDFNGKQWNFTSKQMRKTLGVQLIENGATNHEVSSQLGHLTDDTTEKFYLEVKLKNLSDLNHKFFSEKFNIDVGEESLKLYSEEERKQLYVDFCLNNREVELGFCSKHMKEGVCGKRIGASACSICNKLCTGKKYLSKWISLRDSQKLIVDELIRVYNSHNIEEYEEFIEYKKELSILKRYESVVNEIQSK